MAPRPDAASVHSRRSIASSGLRDSVQNNPPSRRSPPTNNIIVLRISPAAGSATFGYVYLAETEIRNQDAITAYFDSAGREVSVIPCPDFESFIAANNLMYQDILFTSDLPRYVIPAGIRILEASEFNASPRLDWLPEPPDLSSFHASSGLGSSSRRSRSSSSHQSGTLFSRQESLARPPRPDPDGFDSSSPPHYRVPVQNIHMGGRIPFAGPPRS